MSLSKNLFIALPMLWSCSEPQEHTGTTTTTSTTTITTTTDSCLPRAAVLPETDFFTDISASSGIQIDNYLPDPPDGTSINDHSRLAFADINGDGFDDIVMHSLFPNAQNGVPFEHLVFVNNGDGTFSDFSDASGLRDVQAGYFAFADIDDDGDQDIFAGLDLYEYASYRNQILTNDGSGVFTPTATAVSDTPYTITAAALFADFDGDANLDLFVGNGSTMYAWGDFFYAGGGDGSFTDNSNALGQSVVQPSNGAVSCDYDNDGDLDIFVSTYAVSVENGLNTLWENDGGNFTNVAVERGFASLATGNYYLSSTGYGTEPEPDATAGTYVGSNGFGIDCKDVNNDGNLDIFLTTISHPSSSEYDRIWSDPTQLLINQGESGGYSFVNEFLERGLPFNEGDVDGAMVDFDNDGRLDLSVSRDTKYEGAYDPDSERDQQSWFGLMWQQPDGTFNSVGYQSGINDPDLQSDWEMMKGAQNHAWADIDHDGDLDLLVGGRDQGGGRPNFLFRNDIGDQNRWLAVSLIGDGENVTMDAFGARVTITFPKTGEVLMREKNSARGMYNSEDTRWLHFGLGESSCDRVITVRWPDGTEAVLPGESLPDDAFVVVRYPDVVEVL